MPAREVRAFVSMMRTIRAEEALHDSIVIAYSTGKLKKGRDSQVRRGWNRDASRYPADGRRKSEPIVKEGQDPKVALGAFGIGFTKVKGKNGDNDRRSAS